MPLIETTFKTEIINMISSMSPVTDPVNTDAQIEEFAGKLSKIITDHIKTATITVPIIPVQVLPSSGTGATITPTNATIS